jgi:ActR/RegA family two-component response regulator
MTESPPGLRVLVVDDLAEMRVLIRRALSARGYAVDVASTLAEARDLNPAGYAAVLVDAHLGPDQGIDLIAAIAAGHPAAAKRCLLMTGGSAGEIPDGVPYLTKPFKIAELVSAVKALHATETTQAPPDAQATGAPHETRDGEDPGGAATGPVPDHRAGSSTKPRTQPQTSGPASEDQRDGRGSPVWRLLELVRLLRAREHSELADYLHDGPIQELTAVSLELQMMSRSTVPDASTRCSFVLQRLDAAARSLRRLVDGQWPFQVAETNLGATVEQRIAWLLPAPVTVEAADQADALSAGDVPAVVDVMELMLLVMAPASPPVRAEVRVRAQDDLIEVDLTLTPDSEDGQLMSAGTAAQAATTRAALHNLAWILGADAHATLSEQHWHGRITLPREPLQAADLRSYDLR